VQRLVKVILTPPRPEFVTELVRECEGVGTLILELPRTDSFDKFLKGECSVDDVLAELELEYPMFTRELLLQARRLYTSGVQVIPLDPYQEVATEVKVKLFLRKDLEKLEQDLTARYIAMLELNISKVLQEYYRPELRQDFDKLVELTLKYAKFDAERIRFRTELRVRKLVELFEQDLVKFPVAVHTHFLNTLLPRVLSERLSAEYRIEVVDLYAKLASKLGVETPAHPGRELTRVFLEHISLSQDEIRLLAAKSVILVALYPKTELLPTSTNPYPMFRKDLDICTMLKQLDTFEKCREFYYLNILKRQTG